MCVQSTFNLDSTDFSEAPKLIGSEDCLHLNIYVPKNKHNSSSLLPVYFWIHGGAFYAGSGNREWCGPKILLDKHRNMVMVAINYRLSIFGFFSANDVNLPGNIGLKDQTMALKWVNENIHWFGGDPDSITIGGISAGAASVNHHMNSKISRGLFQRAVSQSGTSDCSWAIKSTKEARLIAFKVISDLNCTTEPTPLLACLQNLSVETLMKSLDAFKVPNISMIVRFAPVIEKDSPTAFMTRQSIKQGSSVPWLAGLTNEEGLLSYNFLEISEPEYSNLEILNKNYKTLFPLLAHYEYSSNSSNITKSLKKFYFGGKDFSKESAINFVQLLSDTMINHGLHLSSRKYKGMLYMYMISHRGKNTLAPVRPKGMENCVSHGDDLFYFFKDRFSNENKPTEFDMKLSNKMLSMWYNFIKCGNPTPYTQLWETSDGGHKYLDFCSEGAVMKSNFYKERMDFLDKLNISSTYIDEETVPK